MLILGVVAFSAHFSEVKVNGVLVLALMLIACAEICLTLRWIIDWGETTLNVGADLIKTFHGRCQTSNYWLLWLFQVYKKSITYFNVHLYSVMKGDFQNDTHFGLFILLGL